MQNDVVETVRERRPAMTIRRIVCKNEERGKEAQKSNGKQRAQSGTADGGATESEKTDGGTTESGTTDGGEWKVATLVSERAQSRKRKGKRDKESRERSKEIKRTSQTRGGRGR